MQYLEKTGKYGEVVSANATLLSQPIDSTSTDLYTQFDVFSASDNVIVGEELMTIVSGDGNPYVVTRAQGGTTGAAHKAGQDVRNETGHELLTYTFDGSTYFSAIRASAKVEMVFKILEDAVEIYGEDSSPYQMAVFMPFTRYQPANNTVWSVECWLAKTNANEIDEAVAQAVFQS